MDTSLKYLSISYSTQTETNSLSSFILGGYAVIELLHSPVTQLFRCLWYWDRENRFGLRLNVLSKRLNMVAKYRNTSGNSCGYALRRRRAPRKSLRKSDFRDRNDRPATGSAPMRTSCCRIAPLTNTVQHITDSEMICISNSAKVALLGEFRRRGNLAAMHAYAGVRFQSATMSKVKYKVIPESWKKFNFSMTLSA